MVHFVLTNSVSIDDNIFFAKTNAGLSSGLLSFLFAKYVHLDIAKYFSQSPSNDNIKF